MTQSGGELDAAIVHFRAFFQELDKTFLERGEVLQQIALALLSREHVLLAGPPGTAKSGVVRAVVDRIVDRETNAPSVFARQITESTVQTDLIGPIDFKVLTETGRTEHFTDEGMLGAIHAHLDEVFDGRDMLLRTTLNILHERELKQGTKVTRGAIECALMTSNRYISEILEESRENLLAFVDRIAFLSFIPRGFGSEGALDRVLNARLGRTQDPPLGARLSIQDVDALQAATDEVHFPRELVPRLTQLLTLFHDETQAAVRADPTFVPTRYLSTRTAVRLGRLLKAIVVFDRVMGDPERPMVVRAEDFERLRLGMVLSGPTKEDLALLLERESDPRERSQLSIVQTEREIFDRCLAQLPAPPKIDKKGLEKQLKAELDAVEKSRKALVEAINDETAPPAKLLEVTRQLSEQAASASASAGPGKAPAAALLDTATHALFERALRRGLSAGAMHDGGGTVEEVLAELDHLGAALDDAGDEGARLARWLRGRALTLIDRALTASPSPITVLMSGADGGPPTIADVAVAGDAALARVRDLLTHRRRLLALGADVEGDRAAREAQHIEELTRLGDVLAAAWDAAMVGHVAGLFESGDRRDLDAVFEGLEPLLHEITRQSEALRAIGADEAIHEPRDLLREVSGPRLRPLLAAAFGRFDATDREGTADQVDSLLTSLRVAGLDSAARPADIVHFTTEALLRAEPPAPDPASTPASYEGYLELRSFEQRTSLGVALVTTAERLARDGAISTEPEAVLALVGDLAEDLRDRVVATDLARVLRAVEQLERIWAALTADGSATERIERIAASRFFKLVVEDDALTRFTLELELLGRLFPETGERTAPVSARLAALREQCMSETISLVRERSDARFDEVAGGDA